MIKAGFAGDDAPRAIFPSIVGRARTDRVMVGMGGKDVYVGDQAQSKRGILTINRPLQNGIINNWDDMEKLWHHAFYNELCCDPEEYDLLLTESPLSSKEDREKMMEIMFETFNVPKYFGITSEALAIYSTGRTSGIVVNIGSLGCNVVPIIEGSSYKAAVQQGPIGGEDAVKHLQKLVVESGYKSWQSATSAEMEIIRDITQKMCYVAVDYEQELQKAEKGHLEKNIEHPSGWIYLTVGKERCMTGEIFFRPGLFDTSLMNTRLNESEQRFLISGYTRTCMTHIYQDIDVLLNKFVGGVGKNNGIHGLVQQSIMHCDYNEIIKGMKFAEDVKIQSAKELIDVLYGNIVLCGGSSMYEGMADRLKKEMTSLVPEQQTIKIIAPPERKYSEWIGGSILASLSTFDQMWISKDEYEENGPSILHTKCYF